MTELKSPMADAYENLGIPVRPISKTFWISLKTVSPFQFKVAIDFFSEEKSIVKSLFCSARVQLTKISGKDNVAMIEPLLQTLDVALLESAM